MKKLILGSIFTFCLSAAYATNTPCSGRKGGVSHCMGQFFVCNDGSTSQSKKVCSAQDTPSEKPKKEKEKKQ